MMMQTLIEAVKDCGSYDGYEIHLYITPEALRTSAQLRAKNKNTLGGVVVLLEGCLFFINRGKWL